MSSDKQKIRVISALTIILVLLGCVFFSSELFKNKSIISGKTLGNDSGETLNDFFIEECFDPYLLASSEIKISNEGHVIGFESILSSDDCLDKIKQDMQNKGWIIVESGDNLKCTFTKNSGSYSWVFLNVTSICGETCVVITID